MTNDQVVQREVRLILIAANCGEASPAQLARLDELMASNRPLLKYAAKVLDQQAALAWQHDRRETPTAKPANTPHSGTRRQSVHTPKLINFSSNSETGRWSSAFLGATTFVLGAVLATVLATYLHRGESVDSLAGTDGLRSVLPVGYEAKLVRGTACLWEPTSSGAPAVGSWLTSGESLHLLEGLAEFNFAWSSGGSATLSLEGPAAMMLTSDGMPTLRFGKLTATINAREQPFVLETPVGRLLLTDYGSIGVSAFGNDAEIHVFDGAVSIQSAWGTSTNRDSSTLSIKAGQAMRIKVGGNGKLRVERHPAEKSYFAVQVSMTADSLTVPPAYVAAIKQSAPIGYWRMERESWPRIPNEMRPDFDCRVVGSVARTGRPDNQGVEFGATDLGGEILSDLIPSGLIRDSYTLEVWIKPSHYHKGAVLSLIGESDTPAAVVPHGALLELGGAGAVPTALDHPGRIRFLHRSPAGGQSLLGTSCFSTAAYTLRKWQHVVAVKAGEAMHLYVNGELSGEAHDASELPAGLRLLVGRLYPEQQVRPFKGQLDEIALYDRALRVDEIQSHHRLIRPHLPVMNTEASRPAS